MTVSLPPPALMVSAPPAPSIVSAPEPPMIEFAADEPVSTRADDTSEASIWLKLLTVVEVAAGLVDIAQIDRGRGAKQQRVGAAAAVDRDFGAVIGHGIVAAAGTDRVGAAAAVDRIGARACRDGIGSGGAGDRERCRQARRIHILEIADDSRIAGRLVAVGQIDRGRRRHRQRVGAGAAVDRGLAAAVGHGVVAAAGIDHVGAAAAVDRVGAGARRDGIRG